MKKLLKIFLGLVITLCLIGCQNIPTSHQTPEKGICFVHYIDVGQADATLIQTEDKNILIDAGNKADSQKLIDYFHQNNVKKIDVAVGTHAHEDHIGGFPSILKEFQCDTFYISNKTTTSRIYESLLDTLDEQNINTKIPSPGENLDLGSLKIEFFGPLKEYDNLNNSSIPLKVSHGENSFLFTGDAESQVEKSLIKKWGNHLEADVYQAGHHGSSSSNSEEFMKVVNPETVIISSNKEDAPKYGHPHVEVLKYLKKNKINLYRTDKQGTIILTSDGKSYQIQTEKEFSGDLYRK